VKLTPQKSLLHRIKNSQPLLRQRGFGIFHLPHYVNHTPKPHSVDVVLISFIVRGKCQHIMGDEIYDETGGSLGITHYGQEHDIITSAQGIEIFNLYLDLQNHPLPRVPESLQSILSQLLPLHPHFSHQLNKRVRLEFEDPQPMIQLLRAMHLECEEKPLGYEDSFELLLQIFLIRCCRYALKKGLVLPEDARPAGPMACLELVRRHLDTYYTEPQNLAHLSRLAHLQSNYLCRAFKNYVGKSIFQYLLERRIQAAMMQLRHSSDKILTIALATGFANVAYFNTQFKKIIGVTPSRYRQVHKVKTLSN
jgi:AraC-like DNA-binding protein